MADLDARRNEVLGRAASSIQRKFRSYLSRKTFMMLRKTAINMQAVCRGTFEVKRIISDFTTQAIRNVTNYSLSSLLSVIYRSTVSKYL